MCFTTNKKPRLKTATEDIRVWKVISKNRTPYIQILAIDRKHCKYQKGWHYTETLFRQAALIPDHSSNRWKVEGNAFHSFKNKEHALSYASPMDKVIEMYIPVGGMYYENDIHYVSSDIVWY